MVGVFLYTFIIIYQFLYIILDYILILVHPALLENYMKPHVFSI